MKESETMWNILRSIRPRQFVQFQLRTLLTAMTLIAVWLGWFMNGVRDQQRVAALVRTLGGQVDYSYLPPPPLPPAVSGQFTAELDLPFPQGRFYDIVPNWTCRNFPALARWIDERGGRDFVRNVLRVELYRRRAVGDALDGNAAERELASICAAHRWSIYGKDCGKSGAAE
jgi:hypothetical protein